MNRELRKKIVHTIINGGEGHIGSAFSIVDILDAIYSNHLKFESVNPDWEGRDYFVMSKGHGAVALFVILEKFGLISQKDLNKYGKFEGILGGHPDRTKVPGVEASTGSLGHGFPYAVGIALGQMIKKRQNKVYVLIGDGEAHEGTTWESALVSHNLELNNLCCIVDFNGSAAQILPHPDMVKQWEAFGWNVIEVDGHDETALNNAFQRFNTFNTKKPTVIIAHTVKGKGVSFLESHGAWHHKIPDEKEFNNIMEELNNV